MGFFNATTYGAQWNAEPSPTTRRWKETAAGVPHPVLVGLAGFVLDPQATIAKQLMFSALPYSLQGYNAACAGITANSG
jgi:hypothetical protein